MLFNSLEFALFLTIVFSLYWFVTNKNLKRQNILLLLVSYFFYSWWDWRLTFLLLSISLINYFLGIWIEDSASQRRKKVLLLSGLITDIGILGFFKYHNFFIDSFIDFVSLFGYNLPESSTKIILPLGISFYTFLTLSYIIDISKGTLKASRNIVEGLLTFSFFPIILAGPIQRPASLLPQITAKRVFNYNQAVEGLKQIVWGLFVKVVIADNLAFYVDEIFGNFAGYSGSTLLLAVVFYSVQIYADFSGYSDMAIGIAKLFGFSLMRNFAYPYFSRDITVFWKRWHMSLTSWFRDYLFLPISFAVSYKVKTERVLGIKTDLFLYIVASSVTWLLTGLWHGANYTFILWGLIHGFFLIIYQWQKAPRKRLFKKLGINNNNYFIIITETILTLAIVMNAWVFFRSESIQEAFLFFGRLYSPSLLSVPAFDQRKMALIISLFVVLFFSIEWFGRDQQFAVAGLGSRCPKVIRWAIYYVFILIIFIFAGSNQQFIYFQF